MANKNQQLFLKVVRQHVNYDAFGNRIGEVYRNASGTVVGAGTAGSIQMLFGFTGRDWDTDSELQYNRARWFDPKTGRWLSQDPISFSAGDTNLYRYVGNDATNWIDPSGLDRSWADFRYDWTWGWVWPREDFSEKGAAIGGLIEFGNNADAARKRKAQLIQDLTGKHFNQALPCDNTSGATGALDIYNETKDVVIREAVESTFELEASIAGGALLRPSGNAIWSSTSKRSSVKNAYGHWKKHGGEFPGFKNVKVYVDEAWNFILSPPQGTLSKTRANGEIILFDPATDRFAVFLPDGTPKTMFVPDPSKHGYACNLDYFNAQ